MNRRITSILATVIIGMTATFSFADDAASIEAMNTRGFKLLQAVAANAKADQNVLLSPYSIASAFGLAWLMC